ncbi:MAG TPA: isocitrate lyase/phosphoenolpyruvate mutase family protein [bacterium]|nr:isocitrate lyase/phosphoenolpyruvate mutase family protein [bacterium]
MDTAQEAAIFKGPHELPNAGLLLPNARDAAGARIFEVAGFRTIGTTSAGIAYARGVRAVGVPATADIEAGVRTRRAAVSGRRGG